MKEQNYTTAEPIKPDLKHDSMEYAASTEGDDILDSDKGTILENEAEEISAEELALLQEDDADDIAEALNSAETDSQADEDNFLNEKDLEETSEVNNTDKEKHQRR